MAEQNRILVVDDDREIVDLIAVYLTGEGMSVDKAYDGQECLERLGKERYSLVVLDVMMPELDGLAVCRRLREKENIPVIIVSAKTSPMDKVMGLATGADDYLAKPFHPLELVARVKAQLRRFTQFNTGAGPENGLVLIKDLAINEREHSVKQDDRPIHLTPKEFDILLLLASHPNRVFSSEQIFELVWGEAAYQQDNTIMVHVRKLRDKLGDDTKKPRYIRTVWGVGYKFES